MLHVIIGNPAHSDSCPGNGTEECVICGTGLPAPQHTVTGMRPPPKNFQFYADWFLAISLSHVDTSSSLLASCTNSAPSESLWPGTRAWRTSGS